ncbi:MAG: hypothetical protein H0U57_08705 [Tatlockia sp.]|nr:hypothetical protein [Tatlockia sp.]
MASSIEILKSIKSSYELHSNDQKKFIGKLYANTSKNAEILLEIANTEKQKQQQLKALQELHARRELLLDIETLSEHRKGLPVLLDFYQNELSKTNPALFRFLSVEQKLRLKNKLLLTYFLLFAQYQLDVTEDRKYTLNDHHAALDLCSKRIQELDLNPDRGIKIDFNDELETEISLFSKCLYYLGLTILAEWIVERVNELTTHKTGALIQWMSEINVKRLYWIWGGGMLASALELLPSNFMNTQDSRNALAAPSPVTGYMSFVLYYARLGVNLFLLFKHTLGPWISKGKESEIPVWERFTTQWNQRKFAILNDLFWGPINMVCFFWLKGNGFLGFAGNILTVFLLTTDLFFTIWRHWEETTQREANLLAFKRDRENILEQINKNSKELLIATEDDILLCKAKQNELEAQLKQLTKMEAKARFDWKYKDLNTFNDCCYALGLILAFCVVICFFCPPAAIAPLSMAIIGLIGSILCFLLTTIYTARSCQLEMNKTEEQSQLVKAESEELLNAFLTEKDPNLKKQLYLEIKALMAESDYQKKLAEFQLKKGFRSVFIDALFPVVVFTSLVFLPTGIGLGLIALAIASAVISKAILNRYEPQAQTLPDFDEDDYKAFKKNPSLTHFAPAPSQESKQGGFFSAESSQAYYKLLPEENLLLNEAIGFA